MSTPSQLRSPLISHSDPEAHALLTERVRARQLEFLAGQIGEATFLRSLLIYGYDLPEARQALRETLTAERRS